jgi:adenylate kinase
LRGILAHPSPIQVPDELLVERVVGRRLDPVTGKIYHLKYSPPENEEIASRLTQRFDDTEEKVHVFVY